MSLSSYRLLANGTFNTSTGTYYPPPGIVPGTSYLWSFRDGSSERTFDNSVALPVLASVSLIEVLDYGGIGEHGPGESLPYWQVGGFVLDLTYAAGSPDSSGVPVFKVWPGVVLTIASSNTG